MRKALFVILIVSVIFVSGLLFSNRLAPLYFWQQTATSSPYNAQPKADLMKPANLEEDGAWYCPENPKDQVYYDWYKGPQAHREWWCW